MLQRNAFRLIALESLSFAFALAHICDHHRDHGEEQADGADEARRRADGPRDPDDRAALNSRPCLANQGDRDEVVGPVDGAAGQAVPVYHIGYVHACSCDQVLGEDHGNEQGVYLGSDLGILKMNQHEQKAAENAGNGHPCRRGDFVAARSA